MADIFELLKNDHDDHRKLLKQLSETHGDSEDRRELFEKFKLDALSHANAEEQSLYAAMLGDPDLQDEGSHSTAEHHEIEEYIEELEDTDMSSPGWIATFEKLRERYEHHIDEEEEETFAAAKKKFSDDKRQELGAIFAKRKPAEKEEEREAA
ncbi:hemerythrin HHE cation-binding protein [Pacificimonas flava]|uniref:Hemerythrin HHE cation-binding protein n=2 Tax=Pacificimonas TaxID=1960290 RepID=A0A219B7V3_9SPHN|nr:MULTISPECIES: hemerythrin domain-containing protein [Pacificimonas]MBZ6379948.1 hemerythrin domain-containing protein [Pacificimonas aurantium]OWV34470.1 hemerythrin HHE cation-binding protein [Pacificimonas flava]